MSKNIGIIAETFILWNGGIDFIKHILCALSLNLEDVNVTIFVPRQLEYKKYNKGIKREIIKIKELYFTKKNNYKSTMFADFPMFKQICYLKSDLSKLLKQNKIDFILPCMDIKCLKFGIPACGYLYDCQHRYYPEFFSREEIKTRDEYFTKMCKEASKIMVNAKSAKDDIIKFFNAKEEQVTVLPFTPKVNLKFLEDNQNLIKKYNLPQKYFLISNQFWLHKDHITAFKAFADFIGMSEFSDYKLICTGLMEDARKPEYIDSLKELIKSLNCEDKILCLGLIPKAEQIEIMKGAKAVIQPTLFEGGPGGGSVYDAISLGVPVVISDISTNLEIPPKDTIFFFMAHNAEDLVQKMMFVAKNDFEKNSKETLLEQSKENMQKLRHVLLDLIEEA